MSLVDSFANIRGQISRACADSGRSPDDVELVAVSKTKPVELIQQAYDTGQRVFGENRLQELEVKAPVLPEDCEWHFIGTIQRNKVRKILEHSRVLHSVDSVKLAQTVSRIAGEIAIQVSIFVQVHIGDESTKHGLSKEELREHIGLIAGLANIDVRGLMCIPPPAESESQARGYFAELRELRDELATESLPLRELSMGMSGDFAAAIAEGATHIRIGSSLFGARG